jgi:nucleoside-diphosphate kinase
MYMYDLPQYSLFLIKPDAVQRLLVPKILARFDNAGLRVARMVLRKPSRKLIEEHYAEHRDAPHFNANTDFMLSGPLVAGIVRSMYEFTDAVAKLRALIGPYQLPLVAGTIRGDWMRATDPSCCTLVHGSSSPEAAVREAELWFGPGGLSDLEQETCP